MTMDCAHFRSNIFAFREKTLPETLHDTAAHHLASCSACNRLILGFNDLDEIIDREKAI